MSTQTSDYPDWLNSTQQQNIAPYVLESNAHPAGGTFTYGPFYVTQWSWLQVFVSNTDMATGAIQFAFDSAFTTVVAELDFNVPANGRYSDVVPVIAPWVRLIVVYSATVPPVQTYAWLFPTLDQDGYKRGQGQLYLLHGVVVPVGAASSITVVPSLVTSGAASLSVNTNATVWNATLISVDATGATVAQLALITSGGAGDIGPVRVALPTDQVRLVLVNNDAAGRTFSYGLVLER